MKGKGKLVRSNLKRKSFGLFCLFELINCQLPDDQCTMEKRNLAGSPKYITQLKVSTLNFYLPTTKQFLFVGDISPDYPPSYLLPLIDINYDQQSEYSQELFYSKL